MATSRPSSPSEASPFPVLSFVLRLLDALPGRTAQEAPSVRSKPVATGLQFLAPSALVTAGKPAHLGGQPPLSLWQSRLLPSPSSPTQHPLHRS